MKGEIKSKTGAAGKETQGFGHVKLRDLLSRVLIFFLRAVYPGAKRKSYACQETEREHYRGGIQDGCEERDILARRDAEH